MRRVGGVFVGIFLAVGTVQAVTGFIPAVPSAAAPAEAEKPAGSSAAKFTGTSAPIKPGSVGVTRYEELINKWGNRCEAITPALLAAQLHQESMGFNPRVVKGTIKSPAGALGIAQFIPGTWQSQGLDANGDGKRDVFDPEDAIPSAASYDCKIASSLTRIPGDKRKNMLAGYNAGTGAVTKYNGVPPYRETQQYVQIITSKAGRFEQ